MASHSCIIISAVLCFLISFPSETAGITEQQFKQYKCSSICTDSGLKNQLKKVCLKLRDALHEKTGYSYDDAVVEKNAMCKKSGVQLVDEYGSSRYFAYKVAICWFSLGDKVCVTKGPTDQTIYYYSYDSLNNRCSNPKQRDYPFEASSGSGGFFGFLSCLKWW